MDVIPQTVLYYSTAAGEVPFLKWFDSLKDPRTKAIIESRLTRARRGLWGNYRWLEKGVLELKINFGPGFRIYFGLDGGHFVILLCGGHKGTQDADIRRAQDYWTDYWRRTHR